MIHTIKNRFNGSTIYECEAASLREAVEKAAKAGINLTGANLTRADLFRADLTGANLTRAYLFRADLTGANLTRANLTEADITEANLTRANLTGACLTGADLTRAYLYGANLTEANLYGANLTGDYLYGANLTGADLTGTDLTEADLYGANLYGATMPDGLPWERYLSETVPALLVAGGKTLQDVLDTGCWECHSWNNCPMHVAFDIDKPEDGPPLLIPRIKEFVQFFDARLIPKPTVENTPL